MDRRNFLRTMLGVAAATALPSEVFPFRKIFLPEAPKIIAPQAFAPGLVQAQFIINDISELKMEYYAKSIPDLIFNPSPLWINLNRSAEPLHTEHETKMIAAMKRETARIIERDKGLLIS